MKFVPGGEYAFCERVTASSSSKWHIRKLSEKGPKFGGGIDTNSLCGRVDRGWDLDVKVSEFNLAGDHICPECLVEYRAEKS